MYLLDLVNFPKERGERMIKLQKYLTDADKVIRADAMNEYAMTDVRDLLKVKEKFDLKRIREILRDPKSEDSVLALNYTLIGICGDETDVPLIMERLTSNDDQQLKRMDALVGSYLMLKKEAGLEFVEKKLFVPALKEDNWFRFYRVLLALRYHADDGLFISKEKIVPVARHMLGVPNRADIVMGDLTRWKDWDSAKRIMELYRSNTPEINPYFREPAINFMKACKHPEAKEYLEEMKKIDPVAFKNAQNYYSPFPKNLRPKEANPNKKGKKT